MDVIISSKDLRNAILFIVTSLLVGSTKIKAACKVEL